MGHRHSKTIHKFAQAVGVNPRAGAGQDREDRRGRRESGFVGVGGIVTKGPEIDVVVDADGTVRCLNLYDFDFTKLGHAQVRRASAVAFDEAVQGWVATRADGVVVGRGASKADAIRQEIEALNPLVLAGRIEEIFP